MSDQSPVIVIDPGHGGSAAVSGSSANNATGPNGLLEKDLTLDLARRVRAALPRLNVVLTRDADTNLGLADRAAVAKNLAAAAFVSIHLNGDASAAVDGSEAFVATAASADSRLLARAVLDRVLAVTGVRDRGVKDRDLGVLLPARHAAGTAATLLEVAFLTNTAQAARLADDGYKQQVAEAIAGGVRDFMGRASGLGLALGAVVGSGRADVTTRVLGGHGSFSPNLVLRWNVPPANFTSVDVLVHFHGYTSLPPADVLANKEGISGADFAASSRIRPTLALIPRGHFFGGKHNNAYDFPAVTAAGGFAALTRAGLDEFATGQLSQPAGSLSGGRLILTAHSGGGAALLQVMRQVDPDEVHLFDALYQSADAVSRWAVRRMLADAAALGGMPEADWDGWASAGGGAMRAIFRPTEDTTSHNTRLHQDLWCALQTVPNLTLRAYLARRYRVEQTRVAHEDIPARFGPQLLSDAGADLTPAPTALPDPRSCPATPARSKSLEDTTAADAVERFTRLVTAAEGKVAAGLMPRLPFDAVQQLDAAAGHYRTAGREADHADHRRRLQAAFAIIPAWLFDTTQSAVGQVEDAALRRRLLGFDWGTAKFPGNSGPGEEAPSRELVAAMRALVPERRVPQLVPFHAVDDVVREVPDSGGRRLFPTAADAFVAMRTAAANTLAADGTGISLTIPGGRGAFRTEQEQRQLSSGNPNRQAVAGNRSAHRYGLAIDLRLSAAGLRVTEATTRPMTNVVAMYRSPVYKWMFLYAADFGWFPYAMEPWHWEYNPPGFSERFATLAASFRTPPAGQSVYPRLLDVGGRLIRNGV